MSILSSLSKAIRTFVDDRNTPESFKVGEKFENYVRKELFTDELYKLVERTHDYSTNSKDFVEASVKPDFKFYDKAAKREFHVEAKFRSGNLYQGKLEWCKPFQLRRYQEYNKQLPVFLILGIGGRPDSPAALSLIPLSEAKYAALFPKFVEQFNIPLNKAVSSKNLWNR